MAPESVRTTAPPTERGIDPSRRQRSDAQRNVVALVEAAKTVFAGSGVDAPAKEITDLAGVGVGTLYRHFPRRSDLIVAVLQHEIDECVEAAAELGTTLGPWEALMGWIERFTDFVGTKRGLASALHSGDPAYDDLPQHLLDRLEPALQTLLARAVDGGYARDDVTAREVLTTIALHLSAGPRRAAELQSAHDTSVHGGTGSRCSHTVVSHPRIGGPLPRPEHAPAGPAPAPPTRTAAQSSPAPNGSASTRPAPAAPTARIRCGVTEPRCRAAARAQLPRKPPAGHRERRTCPRPAAQPHPAPSAARARHRHAVPAGHCQPGQLLPVASMLSACAALTPWLVAAHAAR